MKTVILDFLRSHRRLTYAMVMILCVIYLLPIVFRGFDVCDTGYYLTFYRYIFSDPNAVEYNFMYYLSGLVGGGIAALFPSLTLAGWRLAGVALVMLSQLTVTLMLRRTVPFRSLLVANMVMTAALAGLALVVNSDLIAILLYCVVLTLIFKGLTENKTWMLALAGVVMGVNIFARLPNVTALIFALTPFLYNSHEQWRQSLRQASLVIGGAVAGVAAMLILMAVLGHLDVYIANFKELMTIATDGNAGSSHSLLAIMKTFGEFYYKMIIYSTVLGLIIFLFNKTYGARLHSAFKVVIIAVLLLLIPLIMQYTRVLDAVWMLSLWGCLWVWLRSRDNRPVRLAAGLGVAMMLLFPLGSDGAYNNGAIIALIALPVAMTAWLRRGRWLLLVAWFTVAVFHMSRVGAYFDGGMLWKKTAKIETAFTGNVCTLPIRADITNECLQAMKTHGVASGDTMMVYGSAPMLNYLTDTKPAIGCSWPELLPIAALSQRLMGATTAPPRFILRQHFITIGKDWTEPMLDWRNHYEKHNSFMKDEKLAILNDFIEKINYAVVWENDYFTLYERPK